MRLGRGMSYEVATWQGHALNSLWGVITTPPVAAERRLLACRLLPFTVCCRGAGKVSSEGISERHQIYQVLCPTSYWSTSPTASPPLSRTAVGAYLTVGTGSVCGRTPSEEGTALRGACAARVVRADAAWAALWKPPLSHCFFWFANPPSLR